MRADISSTLLPFKWQVQRIIEAQEGENDMFTMFSASSRYYFKALQHLARQSIFGTMFCAAEFFNKLEI